MGAYLSSPLAAAGDAFSSKMAERQKETMAMQREFQRQAMENQMKRQMAMRMASTRETLQWQVGFWCTALCFSTGTGLVDARLTTSKS